MPVITPGRAIGRMINRLICSRPKNRVRAMAAAIRAAAGDRPAAAARGAAGREYALQHYDRARLAQRFVDLVDDLAAGAR